MAHEADYAIGAALLEIAVYDGWAMATGHETISSAVRRHAERPWGKLFLCTFIGGVTLHFLSETYDPANLILGKERHAKTL